MGIPSHNTANLRRAHAATSGVLGPAWTYEDSLPLNLIYFLTLSQVPTDARVGEERTMASDKLVKPLGLPLQTDLLGLPRELLPTMYDLLSEDPEELGLP